MKLEKDKIYFIVNPFTPEVKTTTLTIKPVNLCGDDYMHIKGEGIDTHMLQSTFKEIQKRDNEYIELTALLYLVELDNYTLCKFLRGLRYHLKWLRYLPKQHREKYNNQFNKLIKKYGKSNKNTRQHHTPQRL